MDGKTDDEMKMQFCSEVNAYEMANGGLRVLA